MFELAYAELSVEEELVEGTLLFFDSLEESEVRKLARDLLRRSFRNAMVTQLAGQAVSVTTSASLLQGGHGMHRPG